MRCLFFGLGDYILVCIMELGKIVVYNFEFENCGVKLLGFLIDFVEDYLGWIEDIEIYIVCL